MAEGLRSRSSDLLLQEVLEQQRENNARTGVLIEKLSTVTANQGMMERLLAKHDDTIDLHSETISRGKGWMAGALALGGSSFLGHLLKFMHLGGSN